MRRTSKLIGRIKLSWRELSTCVNEMRELSSCELRLRKLSSCVNAKLVQLV